MQGCHHEVVALRVVYHHEEEDPHVVSQPQVFVLDSHSLCSQLCSFHYLQYVRRTPFQMHFAHTFAFHWLIVTT